MVKLVLDDLRRKQIEGVIISDGLRLDEVMDFEDFENVLKHLKTEVEGNWQVLDLRKRWAISELAYALVENLDKYVDAAGEKGEEIRNLIREFADEVFSRVEMDDELLKFVQSQQSPDTSR